MNTEGATHSLRKDSARHGEGVFDACLREADFKRLSGFIGETCGIRLPPIKKLMLEGRLRKRLRALGMDSFGEYCDYVLSPEGLRTECVHMIDFVTTNKTDFFRESPHFDYLMRTALPELLETHGAGSRRHLRAWSAACSTGEEPYTLAMVLSEFGQKIPGYRFSIQATDISTQVLEKAKRGIYDAERVEPVPPILKKKYLMRSRDPNNPLVRIVPELRASVSFRRLNFMDEDYGVKEPLHLIFCRNVLIYFDRDTRQTVLERLCSHLEPGGYLITGHSETLHKMDLPLENRATTVYKKIG